MVREPHHSFEYAVGCSIATNAWAMANKRVVYLTTERWTTGCGESRCERCVNISGCGVDVGLFLVEEVKHDVSALRGIERFGR